MNFAVLALIGLVSAEQIFEGEVALNEDAYKDAGLVMGSCNINEANNRWGSN